jgi:hypothetical protein
MKQGISDRIDQMINHQVPAGAPLPGGPRGGEGGPRMGHWGEHGGPGQANQQSMRPGFRSFEGGPGF